MPRLDLTLFGGFAASVSGESITQFRTDKMRALLAYLAMNAERPFRRELLATLLWPDWSDEAARRNLRQTLHRLRQMLDKLAPDMGADLFTTTRQTVQLNGTAVSLGVTQFQQHLQACETHPHANLHSCRYCLDHMQQAVALYRGDFLEGFNVKDAFPFEEWFIMQREQLQQQILELLDKLALAFTQQGDYPQAQRYANQQVIIAPWRESAHRQLMRLYMLQEQRSKALAQYESCRRLLAEELGVEPSAETVRLRQQIKEGTFETAVDPRTPTHGFPTQLTPFIGRQETLTKIMTQLADDSCRLLTLIGPGGTGKTRLSVQVGQVLGHGPLRYKDGAYFIPLVAVTDTAMLVTMITQSLGIQLTEQISPKQQLLTYLQDKSLLLVCDNFEQLLSGAHLLGEIVAQASQVQILVTSRQPLNLQAEWRQTIGGLDYSQGQTSEAVRFFQRNARRVAPQFQMQEADGTAVLELCCLVDGLPLALELAAAWTRLMDCPTILRETKKSLDFLASPLDDLPERHQSIRAVLTQSWQMLPSRLQNILEQMALFAGSFTLEAVLAIVPDATMLDMATLLDKSLLHWQPNGRYEMHVLLRQFARSQPHTESSAFRENYGRFYLNFVANQEHHLRGKNPQQAIAAIRQELNNVRQAWQWALDLELTDALAASLNGLNRFWHFVGFFHEATQQLQAAQATVQTWRSSSATIGLQCQLHRQISHFLGQSGQYKAAITEARTAQTVAAQLDNNTWLAQAQSLEGEWQRHLGEFERAKNCLETAVPLFANPSRSRDFAHALNEIGLIDLMQSQYDAALSAFKRAYDIYENVEDKAAISTTLGNMAYAYQQKADYAPALMHVEQALTMAQTIGYKQGIVKHSLGLGSIYLEQGNIDQARSVYQDALQMAKTLGYVRGVITCQIQLGTCDLPQGKIAEAEQWYQMAKMQAEESNLQDLIALVVGRQGTVLSQRGETDRAIAAYKQAAQLWRSLNNQTELGLNLRNLGYVYVRIGDYERAKDYFEQSLTAVQSAGARQAIARTLIGLGNVYKRLGHYQRAITHFEQAQTICQLLAYKRGLSLSTGGLGNLHYEQGDYALAQQYFISALQLCKEMGDELNTAVWLMNLGEVAKDLGQYDEALDYNKQATALIRAIASTRRLPHVITQQAEIRFERKEFEQARLLLAEVLHSGDFANDQFLMFRCNLLRVRLEDALGETETAVANLHTMLADFPHKKYQAEIHYYLWQLAGEETVRETAVQLYQTLLDTTPNHQYRQQLDVLQTHGVDN